HIADNFPAEDTAALIARTEQLIEDLKNDPAFWNKFIAAVPADIVEDTKTLYKLGYEVRAGSHPDWKEPPLSESEWWNYPGPDMLLCLAQLGEKENREFLAYQIAEARFLLDAMQKNPGRGWAEAMQIEMEKRIGQDRMGLG
ncbi:MAG: hypothetical protein KGJ06_06940, partial [Pseudomonadota bacterium]|nr:hypothetical protein [Pseudomonadota bacterium]